MLPDVLLASSLSRSEQGVDSIRTESGGLQRFERKNANYAGIWEEAGWKALRGKGQIGLFGKIPPHLMYDWTE